MDPGFIAVLTDNLSWATLEILAGFLSARMSGGKTWQGGARKGLFFIPEKPRSEMLSVL